MATPSLKSDPFLSHAPHLGSFERPLMRSEVMKCSQCSAVPVVMMLSAPSFRWISSATCPCCMDHAHVQQLAFRRAHLDLRLAANAVGITGIQ